MLARPGEDQVSKVRRIVEDLQAAPVEIIVLAGRGVFPVNAEIYSDARPDFGREADFTPGHGDFDDVVIVIKDFHRVGRRSGPFWVGRARGRSPVVIYGIEDIDVVGKIVGEKLPFGCAPFDCAPFGCAQGLRQGPRLGAMEAGVNEELHAVVFPELVAVVLADHGTELGAMNVEGEIEVRRIPERVNCGVARMPAQGPTCKAHTPCAFPVAEVALELGRSRGLRSSKQTLSSLPRCQHRPATYPTSRNQTESDWQ